MTTKTLFIIAVLTKANASDILKYDHITGRYKFGHKHICSIKKIDAPNALFPARICDPDGFESNDD